MTRRILFLSPSWLGDAVMAEPTFRSLRAAFPEAHIGVFARRGVCDVWALVPGVDELIVYDRPPRPGAARALAFSRAVERLGAFAADLAVLLPRSFGAAWTAALAGVPRRVGFASSGRSFLLTDPVPRRPELLRDHRVRLYHSVLRPLGIEGEPGAPALRPPPEARAAVEALLGEADSRPIVALNPGAQYGPAKRWPADHYADLAGRLLAERPDLAVVLVGSKGDRDVCAHIADRTRDPRLLDLSGRTTIPELAALLERAALLVTNDTGAMHVADAVGTPIVALFGPTDPVATPPFRDGHALLREPVDCAPCLLRRCPIDHRCMTRLDPGRVLAAALERLS